MGQEPGAGGATAHHFDDFLQGQAFGFSEGQGLGDRLGDAGHGDLVHGLGGLARARRAHEHVAFAHGFEQRLGTGEGAGSPPHMMARVAFWRLRCRRIRGNPGNPRLWP